MWELIKKLIVLKVPESRRLIDSGHGLDVLDDGAVFPLPNGKHLVLTVDSFTVNPIEFPGGNIGSLAAHGTINDVVMMGGTPIGFMDTVVVEEGFPMSLLNKLVSSMINEVISEGISILGGDFKVMPKGAIDKIVIGGVGIGISENPIIDVNIRPGDKILITSPIAEHGATILASQLGLLDEVKGLKSDSRFLTKVILPLLKKYASHIHGARDPTRGGLAAVLNEWASTTGLTILIKRGNIPIKEEVSSFLEAMGADPLSTASEGVAVLAVASEVAGDIVHDLKTMGEKHATLIGEVIKPHMSALMGKVIGETEIGGRVIIEPKSINLPRIC